MISVEDAQKKALLGISTLGAELVSVDEALGRVLAEDLIATVPVPRFTNSAMDGYALHSRSTAQASAAEPVRLDVIGESAAGDDGEMVVTRKEAARIFTGAPLPKGCDAVVMQENVTRDGHYVLISEPVGTGANVRHTGEDVAEGTTLLRRGTIIGAGDIAVAATQGRVSLSVTRRPRVAILPTGNELVEIDTLLTSPATKVGNGNALMLAAQVREAGGVPLRLPIVGDSPEAIGKALEEAAAVADLVLTSGGVSVGEHDYVKSVLAERGKVTFHKVAMRPGKPLAVGSIGATPFFGLPGNPVSSFVSFELFVRPALRAMQGARDIERVKLTATLTAKAPRATDRRNYVRVRIVRDSDKLLATPSARQGSADLTSLAEVDGLALIEPGSTPAAAHDQVSCLLLRTV
ncbi:MAG: gephyrin-like molybdotransferase Glp [Myxococcota bacterium]|nr:gephyrin-like molybdotransferase Glp [Myxococcota bacterium]